MHDTMHYTTGEAEGHDVCEEMTSALSYLMRHENRSDDAYSDKIWLREVTDRSCESQ